MPGFNMHVLVILVPLQLNENLYCCAQLMLPRTFTNFLTRTSLFLTSPIYLLYTKITSETMY